MGREIHGPIVVHSSIALLQERFRQLQRVKEMREERELKKIMLTDPKHFNSNPPYEPTRLFFHPELIIPSSSRSSPHVYLSLWPTSQEDKTSVETPVSMSLRPTQTQSQSLQASWKNFYDWDSASDSHSGVDTSLHL